MNDTTNTPDESDGRGSVTTGELRNDGAERVSDGSGPASAARASADNGSGGIDGAETQRSSSDQSGAGSASPPRPSPSPSMDPEAGRAAPADASRGSVGAGSTAAARTDSLDPRPRPTPTRAGSADGDVEAQLPQLRSPSGNGSIPHAAPGVPGEVPMVAVPTTTAPPTAPGPPPTPAPGPVPSPGPGAAVPPPWRRMLADAPPDRAAPSTGTAGDLLDDGSPAFMEPPESERPARESTSWQVGGQRSYTEASRSAMRAVRNRPPRQAALQLKRLDPWSVLKLALVLAVVLFFIWLVAVGVLYGVLGGMGVWDRLNGTYTDLVAGAAATGSPLISVGRVFGLAAVIGAINSLLFAVAITVGAFVYNVSADLVGGIEVTLSERD